MTRMVHYMIRRPGAAGEVIYPFEFEASDDYYGFGAFFLGGRHVDDVDEAYTFWAIRDSRAIPTKLFRQTANVFTVAIDGVGQFRFRAKKMSDPARYTGGYAGFGDDRLVRQLAPFDHRALDVAVWEHDFYFVGFTPKLDINR